MRLKLLMLCIILISLTLKGNSLENRNPTCGLLVKMNNIDQYLDTLKGVMVYLESYKKIIDLNMYFGLFLQSVNLKVALVSKSSTIPKSVYTKLKEIIAETTYLMQHYQRKKHKHLPDVIRNDGKWVSVVVPFTGTADDDDNNTFFMSNGIRRMVQLPNYTHDMIHFPELIHFRGRSGLPKLRRILVDDYRDVYHEDVGNPTIYDEYVDKVFNIDEGEPNPRLSDLCIKLIDEQSHFGDKFCPTSKPCINALTKGNTYGYAVTHRLLWLIIGYYARRCSLISVEEDTKLAMGFCDSIYKEAEYIANNGITLPDLMFEQISLCSLLGYEEFLQSSWFEILLKYQSVEGYFHYKKKDSKRRLNRVTSAKSDSATEMHTTAAAIASISAAIRFIIETTNYTVHDE